MFEDEKTITLIKPVTIGKGESAITYDELKLREPNAGELEKAARADTSIGVVINMISLIGGVPRTVAEKLCRRDLAAASSFLEGFTTPGQPEEAGQS
ncbi:hypothetical protein PS870_06473 [Pseudomonas fluorescens]|uniref:Phage tail assembly protein n=1 Tax=Pseudomonas fluorescens TaxID=294 RepID=A0A5E7QJE7_PSEFL|nr:phage tail assembly protein [Pseudomonas fluorescens]VVP61904.1 hypothetical protein PS870_06473 [Pseudomonas fluorescens]